MTVSGVFKEEKLDLVRNLARRLNVKYRKVKKHAPAEEIRNNPIHV